MRLICSSNDGSFAVVPAAITESELSDAAVRLYVNLQLATQRGLPQAITREWLEADGQAAWDELVAAGWLQP